MEQHLNQSPLSNTGEMMIQVPTQHSAALAHFSFLHIELPGLILQGAEHLSLMAARP